MVKEKIVEILRKHKHLTRYQLAQKVMLYYPGISDRELRLQCKQITKEGKDIIGSNGSGYFLVRSQHQLISYIDSLEKKIRGLAKARFYAKRAYQYRKQLKIS